MCIRDRIFFALLIAHALFDYPLQGDFLSRNKNRHYKDENNNVKGLWIHCLTSHSILHAGSVWLITGSFVIGIMEFALHWVIDFLKCEGITNFKVWDEVKNVIGSGGVLNKPIRTGLEMNTEPIIDVDMESGDAIWIPKHFPHLATSLTPRLSVSFPLAECTDVDTVREDRTWITL